MRRNVAALMLLYWRKSAGIGAFSSAVKSLHYREFLGMLRFEQHVKHLVRRFCDSEEHSVTRLTKFEIENRLLGGKELGWKDASKKNQKIILKTAKARRLFQFLLVSRVRKPSDLPTDFVSGLASSSNATDDPAGEAAEAIPSGDASIWRLQSIETMGVGGVNTFGGDPFSYEFDGESWLAQGPNGSGKSSLIGAMLWAMTSMRPRDHGEIPADAMRPVYSLVGDDQVERQVGQWPPLVSFPADAGGLSAAPKASATLVFEDSTGRTAAVSRCLNDGRVSETRSPNFAVPPTLVEAGLVMPARLSSMKFGEGGSLLSEAVQRLTGLDDLIALGQLCEGLCNKGREYLSFRKKDLARLQGNFDEALSTAREQLKKVDRRVPEFLPLDTTTEDSNLAKFGKELRNKSADLIKVISGDLAGDLDLSLPVTQQSVAVAIAAAREDVAKGMKSLPIWQNLDMLLVEIDEVTVGKLEASIVEAKRNAIDALALLRRSENDDRFRLKAMAAAWHASHADGEVEQCPLCSELLKSAVLKQELEALRLAGEAASRTFADNERAIVDHLTAELPVKLRNVDAGELQMSPLTALRSAVRATFVENSKYSSKLVAFSKLAEDALNTAPDFDLDVPPAEQVDPRLKAVSNKIWVTEQLLQRRSWFLQTKTYWENWWATLATLSEPSIRSDTDGACLKKPSENWTVHLNRLSEATLQAEPYRLAAEALRTAWKNGKEAHEIEIEMAARQDIADAIEPLKSLGSLGESLVRDAILGLSDRMENILDRTLITEKVQFQEAKYNKREGVTIRAAVSKNVLIDATLVANTSWIRAVLWAFIFAFREEAVEQAGYDAFPLIVLDDPQSTFDDQHRHRWSQQIASLQGGPGKVQVLLATYDQNFLELIKASGVSGRLALLSPAGDDVGNISIYDGALLEKLWQRADKSKAPADAQAYLSAVRVQVETVLRIMLRGEAAAVNSVSAGFVIGDSRNKLGWLNSKNRSPWGTNATANLVKALNKDLPAIKHLEISHHAGVSHLGMAEAIDVHEHLKKNLTPALDEVFKAQREHFRLHGGMTQLHSSAVVLPWPEGFDAEVKRIPLRILGRAAALTNGRYADGCIEMDDYEEARAKKITLAQHAAYRLMSQTLEPVAKLGDILIVKRDAEVTANSLVVASSEHKLFARRLEFAENHADVAVLIAQANNPRAIAAPVIAQKSTFELQKIVGVIYDARYKAPDPKGHEVVVLDGAAALAQLVSGSLGLVDVVGTSAEPIALDRQHIIVSAPLSSGADISELIGRPVIVEDKGGSRYFKRLQTIDRQTVVLESLDASGEHGPIAMKIEVDDLADDNVIRRIWPVAGILFELP